MQTVGRGGLRAEVQRQALPQVRARDINLNAILPPVTSSNRNLGLHSCGFQFRVYDMGYGLGFKIRVGLR
jgi:hypothetical protein